MKNNLDKFFKDKLEQRSFQARPGDWEEAMRLIEGEEKRKRRRGLFFWTLLVGTLLLFVGGGWWYWTSTKMAANQSNPSMSINKENERPQEKEKTDDTMNLPAIADPEKATEATSETTTNKLTDGNTDAETLASTNGINTTEKSSSTATTATTTKPAGATKERKGNLNAQNKQGLEAAADDRINNNTDIDRSPKTKAASTDAPTKTEETIANEKLAVTQLNQRENTETKQDNTPSQQAKNTSAADMPDNTSSEEAAAKASRKDYTLMNLASAWSELNAPLLSVDSFQLSEDVLPLKRVLRKFKWSVGLSAGTRLYPYGNGAQLVLGYFGGISAKYRLNQTWSINADLLYEQRGGSFGSDSLQTSTRTEFSFGRRTTTYTLTPSQLHSITLPLTLQFKNGKHQIEAGLSLEYLLSVSGKRREERSLYPWERPDPQVVSSDVTEQQVGLEKELFNTWNGNLILGYRYDITRRWNIWGRANYRWKAIFKASDVETGPKYLETEPINLKIGLTFYLF